MKKKRKVYYGRKFKMANINTKLLNADKVEKIQKSITKYGQKPQLYLDFVIVHYESEQQPNFLRI